MLEARHLTPIDPMRLTPHRLQRHRLQRQPAALAIRVLFGCSLLVTAATASGPPVTVAASSTPGTSAPPTPPAPDQDADGAQQWTNPTQPSISDDGTEAVFAATNNAGRTSIFHLDLSDGSTTELTGDVQQRRTGESIHPVISGDGCSVVAVTQLAYDVFRDDDRGDRWDVYRLKLPRCGGTENDWRLVSSDPDAVALDSVDERHAPAVSADGRVVAFAYRSSTQTPPTASPTHRIAIVDLAEAAGSPARTTEPPGWPAAPPTAPYHYRGADQPSISNDGTRISFRADYDPATGAWHQDGDPGKYAHTQVYYWDRTSDTAPLVVSKRAKADAKLGASEPSMSGDGSTIAFRAGGLAPYDTECERHCPTQIYTATITENGVAPPSIVSTRRFGDTDTGAPAEIGNRSSWAPSISDDGTLIAFVSHATNLTLTTPRLGPNDGGQVLIATPTRVTSAASPLNGPRQRGAATSAASPPAESTLLADTTGNHAIAERFSISADGGVILLDRSAPTPLAGTANPSPATHPSAPPRRLGRVVVPIRLSAAALDFGTVRPDTTSAELYTSVVNNGPGSFRPTEVTTDVDAFTVTGGSCTESPLIAPGQTCTVRLTYQPTGEAQTATLTVTDPHGRGVSTSLAGSAGLPRLRIDPAGLDLGTADPGDTTPPASLSVTNLSYLATTVDRFEIGGHHPDDFTIVDDRCSGTTLAPQQQCALLVAFAPTSSGNRTAVVAAVTTQHERAAAVVGGLGAAAKAVVTLPDSSAAPGTALDVRASGFAPGTSVWAAVVGADILAGPWPVDANGNVTGSVTVPAWWRSSAIRVGVADSRRVAVSATIEATISGPTVNIMPGFGFG